MVRAGGKKCTFRGDGSCTFSRDVKYGTWVLRRRVPEVAEEVIALVGDRAAALCGRRGTRKMNDGWRCHKSGSCVIRWQKFSPVGSIVQNGKFSAETDISHKRLKRLLFPTLGSPTIPMRRLLRTRPKRAAPVSALGSALGGILAKRRKRRGTAAVAS